MSRICRSSIFSTQLFHRLLTLDNTSKQINIYYRVLSKKCMCATQKLNTSMVMERCNKTVWNMCQWDLSFNYANKFSTTAMAMAKNKPGKKKGKPQRVDENEMALLIDVESLKKKLDAALECLRKDYIKYVSLRTSAGAIEQVPVMYKDEHYSLQDLAEISRKPNMVILDVEAFPDAIANIIQALQKSHLNITAQQEGTRIYLPIAKVTREYREGLVKSAKSHMVKCKDNIRDIRQKYVRQVTNLEKQPIDLVKTVLANIDLLVSNYSQEAEKLYDEKRKELLGE